MEQEGFQGEDNMKTDLLDIRNMDCMDLMKEFPDNHFDLAVVDPPYGLGEKITSGGTWAKKYTSKDYLWDEAPKLYYFEELRRVSKNYFIFGANYFCNMLPPTRQVIVWHKPSMEGMHTMSNCEIAFTSLDKNSKTISINHPSDKRIHVCQKPVKLYDWIFSNYAEKGMKILDTHMGSGSIAIACQYAGMNLTACELDEDYYKMACERIERETRQLSFL